MIAEAALILVIAHLTLGVIIWLRVRSLYRYPGLLGFPIFGNVFYFYKTLFLGSVESLRHHLVKTAEQFGKNGLCFHYVYGYRTLVMVNCPHVVKKLAFHPNLKDKPVYGFQGIRAYMNGPFSRDRSDDIWKLRRKEYNCLLKKMRIERDFYNVFIKSADQLVGIMLATSSDVDINKATLGVTQSATLENLFGVKSGLVYHPDILSYMDSLKEVGSLVIASPRLARTILKVLRPIDEIFIGKIGELRRMILRGIYDQMKKLSQCLPSENSELPLPVQIASRTRKYDKYKWRLINELQEVFITSTHSIASTLASSIICLAMHSEMQERAWKEQYEIFGNDTRDPTIEDLKQMEFLDRFIKESLRFCSPSFIGKQATGDIDIDGITIPNDAIVVFLLESMRMDPNHWKNPKVFDPDRFLEESETLKYSYTPFGIGIRSCPGMTYAMLQMKITLSKVLRRMKLLSTKTDLRFEDLEFESHIMIEPKNPPQLQVEERT